MLQVPDPACRGRFGRRWAREHEVGAAAQKRCRIAVEGVGHPTLPGEEVLYHGVGRWLDNAERTDVVGLEGRTRAGDGVGGGYAVQDVVPRSPGDLPAEVLVYHGTDAA